METKKNWVLLNIILPLLPLLLRGFTRVLLERELNFETINDSELWFVIAIICLIVSQDLKLRHILLENDDRLLELHNRSFVFLILCGISVFLCAISEGLSVLVNTNHLEFFKTSHYSLSIATYLCCFMFIRYSIETQNEFKLTAKFN